MLNVTVVGTITKQLVAMKHILYCVFVVLLILMVKVNLASLLKDILQVMLSLACFNIAITNTTRQG